MQSESQGTKRSEIINLIRQAATPENTKPDPSSRTAVAGLWLRRATGSGLIASALPHQQISAAGCWIALLSAVAFFALRRIHNPPVRRYGFGTAALVAVSLLTGCAPILHENTRQADIIQFCQTRILDGEACKFAGDYGVRILGIPVKKADPDGAAERAGITRAVGMQEILGHGLIAVDQVVIYGS